MAITEVLTDELGTAKIVRITIQRATHKEVIEFNRIINVVAYADKDTNVANVVLNPKQIEEDVTAAIQCFNTETKEGLQKMLIDWLDSLYVGL